MRTLRTRKTQEKYDEHKRTHASSSCALCDMQPVKSFRYWDIVDNDFPYDKIADPHHMIIIKRHVVESEMTKNERDEYKKLKDTYINNNYEYIFESTLRVMTAPEHFHRHLMNVK